MKILLFIIFLFTTAPLKAQTLKVEFETGKSLLLAKNKEKEALPYFQKIMAANDELLKRTMINFVNETWLDSLGKITFSSAFKDYMLLISQYMSATFSGKESGMNANDHYTAGLIFWSFAANGLISETPKAVSQLMAAYQKGNKQALKYLPDAFASLKKADASVPWADVIEIHGIAASELNTIKPLTKLGWSNYSDLGNFSKLSKAEKDTARDVVLASLDMAAQALPDSFYKAVDYFWLRTYTTFGRQDTVLTGLLNKFFSGTNASQVQQVRKGVAWHYLYKYFYENRPRSLEAREELMTKMKALYPNDERALLLVISEFLKEQRTNTMGFMLSADAKWLNSFGPEKLSSPEMFFYATALTEQNFIPFLDKNPNVSAYTSSIVSGFKTRFHYLFTILNDDKENIKITTAVVSIATDGSSEIISKLLLRNGLQNVSSLKHIMADMQVLKNLAHYKRDLQLPMFINELPSVFNNWSKSDKNSYDSQYLKLLIELVQKNINESKGNNWMAEAGGKNSFDLKDYNTAQKTLDKLKTFLN
ncbi:MAG: hypothetical protein ACXWV5_05175 [Flavitalea sp.]